MTLKALILLFVVFSLGEAQEILQQPKFAIDEPFMNLGPSMIHSVKGKFYEEKQKKIVTKPRTHNLNVTESNPHVNLASQLQHELPNISNTELSNQGEKIIFRRNKGSLNNVTEPKPERITFPNDFRKDSPKKLQETPGNNTDSIVLHTEEVVSSYDKNNTMETIKKELAFDSVLIKNNLDSPGMSLSMNSYMSQPISPEADIVHTPDLIRADAANRRLETNTNYESIPSNHLQIPITNENNFMPFTGDNYNMPNNENIATTVSLKQNNKPIMRERNIVSISPMFESKNYGKNVLNNINSDTTLPLRQNSYNFIDKNICDDKESDETLERSGNDEQLREPTKGVGISRVGKSRVMLMDHPRVCYACSSINDPSCWAPDRLTAVKYCRADHPSCLTKLYKYKGLSYMIRDCGYTCEQNALAGGPTKYTSCTICHHDLCNSAYSFKIQYVTIVMLLIFHILFFVFNISVN